MIAGIKLGTADCISFYTQPFTQMVYTPSKLIYQIEEININIANKFYDVMRDVYMLLIGRTSCLLY
jgi:hypothetical protein